jgi:hypothetical protein
MIDKRTVKRQEIEIDEQLKNLSDTEIMLEFSRMLTSIYPHLIKTHNHCYDPFDDITENLYFSVIYSTFSGKYGTDIDRLETQKYGFILHCNKHINHISIAPKNYPFTCEGSEGQMTFKNKQELNEKEFVFILFGDKHNWLSGDSDQVDIETVNFQFVNFVMVDKTTGLNFRNQNSLWVDKNLVDFELVLEDFDQAEHEFYKSDTYAN